MDELTIDEKTYVSSKRAAKITGYAKDYVGQLCREGRVEAKLVGRNWYVLEASIMEHRFGAAPQEEAKPVSGDVAAAPVAISDPVWDAPKYEAEVPTLMPSLASRQVEEPRRVVAEMQNAWQEWFTTQHSAPKSLSDADADFDGHLLPVVETEIHEAAEEGTHALDEEVVRIQHLESPIAERVEEATESESQVVVHRSYEELPITVEVKQSEAYEDLRKPAEVRTAERVESSLILKSLFVGVAFVSVCVALVGTGVVGDIMAKSTGNNSQQNLLLETLLGSTYYKSIK